MALEKHYKGLGSGRTEVATIGLGHNYISP